MTTHKLKAPPRVDAPAPMPARRDIDREVADAEAEYDRLVAERSDAIGRIDGMNLELESLSARTDALCLQLERLLEEINGMNTAVQAVLSRRNKLLAERRLPPVAQILADIEAEANRRFPVPEDT